MERRSGHSRRSRGSERGASSVHGLKEKGGGIVQRREGDVPLYREGREEGEQQMERRVEWWGKGMATRKNGSIVSILLEKLFIDWK